MAGSIVHQPTTTRHEGKTLHLRLEAFVTVRLNCGAGVPGPGMKTQPESKPPLSGVHGFAKLDWVIEWLPGLSN